MNELQAFNYNGAAVRTVEKDSEVWFVAKDVCDVLELTKTTEAIKALDDDEKSTLRISEGTSSKGGNPNMNIINEAGLYALIFRTKRLSIGSNNTRKFSMNSINEYNNDYEIFRTHFNGLSEVRNAINLEVSNLTNQQNSVSSIRKLLKLREFIDGAITFCEETMFDDISLMIQQLRNLKEDFHHDC